MGGSDGCGCYQEVRVIFWGGGSWVELSCWFELGMFFARDDGRGQGGKGGTVREGTGGRRNGECGNVIAGGKGGQVMRW